jgi:hypothetical protein
LRRVAGGAQVQQSWFKEYFANYGEELGRLVGTGVQLVLSDFTPLQRLMHRKDDNGAAG